MYKKYNSGPIEAYKFDKTGLKMKQQSELIYFLANSFKEEKPYTETLLCKHSGAHHSVYKRYPEIRELLHMLNQYYFGTEKQETFKHLHKYDKTFDQNKESMFMDNVKLCLEHNKLISQLKTLEKELSTLDTENPTFEEKYPNVKNISDLISCNPELDFSKAFYKCNNLNDMEQIIINLLEENTRLKEELANLQEEISPCSRKL